MWVAPLRRARRRAVAGAAAALCAFLAATPYSANSASSQTLKLSPALRAWHLNQPNTLAATSDSKQNPTPLFIEADQLRGRLNLDLNASGNVRLIRSPARLEADALHYDFETDVVDATGRVVMNSRGNVYEGQGLKVNLGSQRGAVQQPFFRFAKNGGYGRSEVAEFLGDDRVRLLNTRYSACAFPCVREDDAPYPDWELRAQRMDLDFEGDSGLARSVSLRFKNVPIFAVPVASFPLSNARKSGFLPPTVAVDTVSGFTYSQPYYWHIAPNRDATFTTRLLTKRGVDLDNEFRYLDADYRGIARVNVLPDDRLRSGLLRWGVNAQHSHTLRPPAAWGLSHWTPVSLTANLNRVSDNDYWQDFPRSIQGSAVLTQRLLPTDLTLSGSHTPTFGGLLTYRAFAQSYQTLQSAASPITPPYNRLPQLGAHYQRNNWGGFDVRAEAEYAHFSSNPALTGQPNAQRSAAKLSVSHPWRSLAGYVTPKLELQARTYQFADAPAASSFVGLGNAAYALPTASLDAGLFFERDTQFGGRNWLQTLEPRLFWVHTPHKAQNHLPNYDSGLNDFSLSSIFTENEFSGLDRISASRAATVGLTTRFLEAQNGVERLRLGLAQRFRYATQDVVLPGGAAGVTGLSDVLASGSLNWAPSWGADFGSQYDLGLKRTTRSTAAVRYTPSNYRSLNLAYRLQRGASEQLDLGWQWPLGDVSRLWGKRRAELPEAQSRGLGLGPQRWYSVGRINYSWKDRKVVDSILGFEYDGGSWLTRVVLERLQTGTASATRRIMFQLELVGFSRIGASPLQTLRQNVNRYQLLRERPSAPDPFGNLDY